jgi:tRNA uridine 5-carboxymethylaminomethyl modification enzyme
MVDDLVLQGVTEPYRMLTARAEYRLRLRADNAETRLSPIAESIGCLGAERRTRLRERTRTRAEIETRLAEPVSPATLRERGVAVSGPHARPGTEWLLQADVGLAQVAPDLIGRIDAQLLVESVEDARYAPYIARQESEVAALRDNDGTKLSNGLDFAAIPGLSTEMVERLSTARPQTLGQAGRVRGVTPAALAAILLHARRAA